MDTRQLLELLHEQNVFRDKLLEVIVILGRNVDKKTVLRTFEASFSHEPKWVSDYYMFGRLALQFDQDHQLSKAFISAEGSTEPANVGIVEDSGKGGFE